MKTGIIFLLLLISCPLYSSPGRLVGKAAKSFKETVVEKIVTKESTQRASIVEKYGAESIEGLSKDELASLVRTYENPLHYLRPGRNLFDGSSEKPIFAKLFLREFLDDYDTNMKALARYWFTQAMEGHDDFIRYSKTVQVGMYVLIKSGVAKRDIALAMIHHAFENVKMYGYKFKKAESGSWEPRLLDDTGKQYDRKLAEVGRYFRHLGLLYPNKGLEKVLVHADFMTRFRNDSPYDSVVNKIHFLEDVILNRNFRYQTPWAELMAHIGSTKNFDRLLVKIWKSLRGQTSDIHLYGNIAARQKMNDILSKAIDDSVASAKRGGGDFEKRLYNEPVFDIVMRAADRDEGLADTVSLLAEKHWKQ